MFVEGSALSRYEPWEVDEMVRQIQRPSQWLTRTFFPREKTFSTRAIEFDLIDRGQRLAPFVSPLVAGKPMRREGYRTKSLTPAYIKPTGLVTPQEGFTRMPGEVYSGSLTPQDRIDRQVTETIDTHLGMVDNTCEWMAAQALVKGGIVIEGEDYPRTYVDFGRSDALDIGLIGAAKWSRPTSHPVEDIENAALLTNRTSKGAVVTDLVMDGLTWAYLRKNSKVKELLDTRFRTNTPGQTPTSIDAGPRSDFFHATDMGMLAGRFRFWVYDAYYQDDSGASQPFLPPYTLIGVARAALEGTQYFGAIVDLDAMMEPRKIFVKTKRRFNPSGIEIVTQAAPLVGPRRPNAMFSMKVV